MKRSSKATTKGKNVKGQISRSTNKQTLSDLSEIVRQIEQILKPLFDEVCKRNNKQNKPQKKVKVATRKKCCKQNNANETCCELIEKVNKEVVNKTQKENKAKLYDGEYYCKDKEEKKKKQQGYYLKNREAKKKKQREYYLKNRDAELKRKRDYYNKNKEKIEERKKLNLERKIKSNCRMRSLY